MEALIFVAMLSLVAIPFLLLGWWLIRTSRSIDHLAAVINENDVDFGEFRVGRKTRAWLLFADVRFVVFLVLRRYRHLELPSVIGQALEKARADYLRIVAVFAAIGLVVFAVDLFRNF